jgi:hypothetical protein
MGTIKLSFLKLGGGCLLLALVVAGCDGESERAGKGGSGSPGSGGSGGSAGAGGRGGSAGAGRANAGSSALAGDGGNVVSGSGNSGAGADGQGGASAGEGGVAGNAGVEAGGSPESGAGGSSNLGGAGASPGTESCGAAPNANPTLVPPAELDPDVVALVGTVVGSCLPDDGVDRNAAHVWESDLAVQAFYMRAIAQAECLTTAGCGCAAIEHCLGTYYAFDEAGCSSGCEGEVFTACGEAFDLADGYSFTVDCSRFGLSCDEAIICADGPTVACGTESAVSCNGAGAVEICENGVIRRGPVCADFGLACVDGACEGSGDTCTGGFGDPEQIEFEALGCDGELLQACVTDRTASLDCTARGPGFHCQTLGDASFCGLAAECVPAGRSSYSPTHPASCDGTVLTFCNAGRLEHVDCAELGFTGCTVGSGSYGCTPGVQVSE